MTGDDWAGEWLDSGCDGCYCCADTAGCLAGACPTDQLGDSCCPCTEG
jgi:hypothetical protein